MLPILLGKEQNLSIVFGSVCSEKILGYLYLCPNVQINDAKCIYVLEIKICKIVLWNSLKHALHYTIAMTQM